MTVKSLCLDFYVHLCGSSQVKFSVEVPTSIIQECYQLTLQEYAKRFKVPFLRKLQARVPKSNFGTSDVSVWHIEMAHLEIGMDKLKENSTIKWARDVLQYFSNEG